MFAQFPFSCRGGLLSYINIDMTILKMLSDIFLHVNMLVIVYTTKKFGVGKMYTPQDYCTVFFELISDDS